MRPQNFNIDFIEDLIWNGYKLALISRRRHAHSLYDKVMIRGKEYNTYTVEIKPKRSHKKRDKLKKHINNHGLTYYALSINGYQYSMPHKTIRSLFLGWLQYHIDNPDQQIDCPFVYKAYYRKLVSDLRKRFSRSAPILNSDHPF